MNSYSHVLFYKKLVRFAKYAKRIIEHIKADEDNRLLILVNLIVVTNSYKMLVGISFNTQRQTKTTGSQS